jgi:hypothetical protein
MKFIGNLMMQFAEVIISSFWWCDCKQATLFLTILADRIINQLIVLFY